MDCIVHGVANSWTQLSDLHFHTIHLIPIPRLRGDFQGERKTTGFTFRVILEASGFLKLFTTNSPKSKKKRKINQEELTTI